MTPRLVGLCVALACCAVGAACGAAAIFGIGARDEAGLIIFYSDTARLIAPDTVLHGVSFDVSFSTFGGGCTRKMAHDDVRISGNAVEVRPYDHNDGGNVCTLDLLFLKRVLPVRMEVPGAYVIHLIGLQRGASTGGTNGAAEITRAVVVR